MEQPQQNYNELIMRQMERLEQRFEERSTVLEQRVRSDVEGLRKELVARDLLDVQLNDLRKQIERVDNDRIKDKEIIEKLIIKDKEAVDKRIDGIGTEQLSRQDRLWIRLSQAAAFIALGLTLLQSLSHWKFLP